MQRLMRTVPAVATAALRRTMATAAPQRPRAPLPERPLSPHLKIYNIGISMMASGAFRVSGMVMFFGIAGLSIAYLPSSIKYEDVVLKLQQHPFFNALVKFGVAFPVTYHLLGGLRHLGWDAGVGHGIKANVQTAYGAFAVATAVGVFAMLYEKKAERLA